MLSNYDADKPCAIVTNMPGKVKGLTGGEFNTLSQGPTRQTPRPSEKELELLKPYPYMDEQLYTRPNAGRYHTVSLTTNMILESKNYGLLPTNLLQLALYLARDDDGAMVVR